MAERSPSTERGITGPPPGFSLPVKLGGGPQTEPINTNKLLIPTLGASGTSSAAPSGFGLSGLSLQGSAVLQSSGGFSLSSLASSHLASTQAPSLLSLANTAAASPSLCKLASSHLGMGLAASQGSTFTIPSIFGEKKEERGSLSTSVKTSDHSEINLMSALKLNNDLEVTQKEAEIKSLNVEENILNINILVPHNSFDSIKSILRKRSKTPFSYTLTRYVIAMLKL